MSELKDRLKKLANTESKYPHIFTGYFRVRDGAVDRTREALIFLKNRVSEIEAVLAGDARAKAGLHREAAVAQRILEQDVPQSAQGIVLFVRDGEVFERLDSNFRFENQVAYRRVPHIAQLAFMDEEMEPFLIVSIDSRHARIFDIALGLVQDGHTTEVTNNVETRIRSGGWSNMRYQKRLEAHEKEHIAEVAEAVGKIVRQWNHKRVVLVGPDKATSKLLEALPHDVRRRVIERASLDSKASEKQIVDEALRYFTRAEDAEEAEKTRRARIEIHSSGMACAGVDAVLRALNHGQVHEILMWHDYQERGIECTKCGEVTVGGASRSGACPSCEAGPGFLKDLDLREYITRKAINWGIRHDYIKHPEFKTSLGNVAALLHSPVIQPGHRMGHEVAAR
jgi:rubrerythrin